MLENLVLWDLENKNMKLKLGDFVKCNCFEKTYGVVACIGFNKYVIFRLNSVPYRNTPYWGDVIANSLDELSKELDIWLCISEKINFKEIKTILH